MSILGKVVEFVASDAIVNALEVPKKALQKASEKSNQKHSEKTQLLFEKEPGKNVLLLNQKQFTWVDRFNVYSDYEKVAYTVKGEFTSIKHHLHIFDVNGKEVATVKEKLFSMRPSAIVEANPVDIVFEINGKKIGKMNSKWSIGKRKFNLDFNDWNIEGNFVGWKYKILSGEKTIADISMKLLYWGDTYVVSYDETQNPLLVLMIVLAIDVANAPKKTEDIKRTVHHKTRYWL